MKRKDRGNIHFYSPPDLGQLTMVQATRVTHGFSRHVHQTFCIGTVQKGARILAQAGTSEVVPENAMFVINPEVSHSCQTFGPQGHDYRVMCVDQKMMQDVVWQISEKRQDVPYIKKLVLFDRDLVTQVNACFSFPGQSDSTLRQSSILLFILSELVTRYGESPPRPRTVGAHGRAVSRVCDYIQAHLTERLSLGTLSQEAGLSPYYFQRVFLAEKGVSPFEYQMHSRIKKAGELLLQGHAPADAAVETGFADQSHLTRFFRRIVGMTPGRYRQVHGKPCRAPSEGQRIA